MLADYVIAVSAGVIVAAVVILVTLLSRYARLVEEADKSTRLAKDVWDSMNSRFSVTDARIIDLMAKTEVMSSRLGLPQATPQLRTISVPTETIQSRVTRAAEAPKSIALAAPLGEGTETEGKVLRLLVEGPKTSAQIKEQVGKSREHTARLMKALFDRGLVVRNDRNKPYVYEITDSGKSHVAS
jgi:CRP-like cAMP-binding protein